MTALPIQMDRVERVLASVTSGVSLTKSLTEEHLSYQTWYKWLRKDTSLRADYEMAREDGADALAEEIRAACDKEPVVVRGHVDTGEVQHRKLRIETLRWLAAHQCPKKYGDRQDVRVEGTIQHTVDIASRLAAACARAGVEAPESVRALGGPSAEPLTVDTTAEVLPDPPPPESKP